jgi:hypothetical protein
MHDPGRTWCLGSQLLYIKFNHHHQHNCSFSVTTRSCASVGALLIRTKGEDPHDQPEDGQVAGREVLGINVTAQGQQHVVQQSGEGKMREHFRLPPENGENSAQLGSCQRVHREKRREAQLGTGHSAARGVKDGECYRGYEDEAEEPGW